MVPESTVGYILIFIAGLESTVGHLAKLFLTLVACKLFFLLYK